MAFLLASAFTSVAKLKKKKKLKIAFINDYRAIASVKFMIYYQDNRCANAPYC